MYTRWIACEWLENAEREINRLQSRYSWRESLSVLSLLLGFCMVSEEKKRGKFDMYFLSNDFRELCSYLIMFFYSAIFKKRKLFKRAYICIYLMYSFFFLSIRRVDTACKRLRKKQRKGIEISLTKDNFFASSRLVEATFIRSSSVLL